MFEHKHEDNRSMDLLSKLKNPLSGDAESKSPGS